MRIESVTARMTSSSRHGMHSGIDAEQAQQPQWLVTPSLAHPTASTQLSRFPIERRLNRLNSWDSHPWREVAGERPDGAMDRACGQGRLALLAATEGCTRHLTDRRDRRRRAAGVFQ